MCIVNGCCEGVAIVESLISNARNAIRDGNGGEGGAIIESRTSNTCNAITNGDGGERGATTES